MIFIFLFVMPKYEGKQNVSIDIVRKKEEEILQGLGLVQAFATERWLQKIEKN